MYTPMRVSYTAEMRSMLTNALKAGSLKPTDRAGLLADAYWLAKAGKLGADQALKFAVSYSGETDYIVWTLWSAVVGLRWKCNHARSGKTYPDYDRQSENTL